MLQVFHAKDVCEAHLALERIVAHEKNEPYMLAYYTLLVMHTSMLCLSSTRHIYSFAGTRRIHYVGWHNIEALLITYTIFFLRGGGVLIVVILVIV